MNNWLRHIIPLLIGMYEHHAVGLNGHLPAPPSPRVTVWLPTIMKCDYLGGTIPDLIRPPSMKFNTQSQLPLIAYI